MATARERLRQLSLAQESADNEADRVTVRPLFGLPKGGGILARPIRPSTGEVLEPETATPFTDFGERFLNELGISSSRQRTARAEGLVAVHRANQTIINAVDEQASMMEQSGIAGFNPELFASARIQQQKAADLLDNPDPTIQEFGRTMMQSVAASYDEMVKGHYAFLDTLKGQMTTRLNGLVDLGRAEAAANDGVISLLNEYGERNGINAKLPSLVKQAVSDYIGGTPFTQKGDESRGMLENVPGFNAVFDPSEEITVGNASALVAAVKQERQKSIAGTMAKEVEAATNSGFRLLDKDGVLTFEELPISELEPDISKLNFIMPPGEAFSIRRGLPSKADAARTAQSSMDIAGATAGKMGPGIAQAIGRIPGEAFDSASGFIDSLINPKSKQKKVRPTND